MYKFIKFCFDILIKLLKLLQLSLSIMAFVVGIEFILSIIKIKIPYIQFIFDNIYQFQTLIYNPKSAMLPIDFTFVVVAIEMLILAGLISYALTFLTDIEANYDKMHNNITVKLYKIENQSNKFVIMFNVKIENIIKESAYVQNKIDIPKLENEYKLALAVFLNKNFQTKAKSIDNDLIMYFDNFDDCEIIFDKIFEFSAKAKKNISELKHKFKVTLAVQMADSNTQKNKYIPQMQKLLTLAKSNKIMTLGEFKTRYDYSKLNKYVTHEYGTYILGEEMIDVFYLEKTS